LRFMAAILDISAILEIPPTSTKLSWDRASSEYRSMLDNGERLYGKDIWDKVDIFYATDDRDSYLKNNPVVEEALNWKQEQAIINPILSPYYTSIERIEKYLKGQMYDEAEELFGENLWDLWEVYHRIADIDNKAARQMWKDYPQLNGYTEFRDERLVYIAQRVAELGAKIPEAVPPAYREGQTLEAEVITPDTNKEAWVEGMVLSYVGGGRALPATVAPQPAMTEADFRQIMGEPLYNLWASGEELPLFAQRRLDLLETVYGINFNNMLTQSVQ
jgi:hypothetical protein